MIVDSKGNTIELDEEGYLYNPDQWTPEVASALAAEDGLDLTTEHWEVIDVLRRFYLQFQLSPAMRPLVKAVTAELGPEKGRSIHLMKLFPGSPAKVAARLAGLPKPENCL